MPRTQPTRPRDTRPCRGPSCGLCACVRFIRCGWGGPCVPWAPRGARRPTGHDRFGPRTHAPHAGGAQRALRCIDTPLIHVHEALTCTKAPGSAMAKKSSTRPTRRSSRTGRQALSQRKLDSGMDTCVQQNAVELVSVGVRAACEAPQKGRQETLGPPGRRPQPAPPAARPILGIDR